MAEGVRACIAGGLWLGMAEGVRACIVRVGVHVPCPCVCALTRRGESPPTSARDSRRAPTLRRRALDGRVGGGARAVRGRRASHTGVRSEAERGEAERALSAAWQHCMHGSAPLATERRRALYGAEASALRSGGERFTERRRTLYVAECDGDGAGHAVPELRRHTCDLSY